MEVVANYAGFWLRVASYVIDYVIIQLLQSILIIPIIEAMGYQLVTNPEINWDDLTQAQSIASLNAVYATMMPMLIIGLTITLLYYALFESSKYQATPGKMVLKLQVTDLNGVRLNLGLALLRNFSKIFSAIFLMIGYLIAAFTPKRQGLHDMIANTLVIRKDN